MKRLLLLCAFLFVPFVLCASDSQQIQIRVDLSIIEMAEETTKDYGVEQSTLLREITKRLAQDGIMVKNDPNLPQLVLRIKSMPADSVICTFIHAGFYEEATLERSKKTVWAMTWSQANMITGSKETYTENVTKEVMYIVNSFILDYQKMMQI